MAAAKALRAAEKQKICRRVVTILRKRYPGAVPGNQRPVVETLLHAVCLENTSLENAEAALQALLERFHDLNEIRVSSISELETALRTLSDPEWRALRIRSVLGHIFELHYRFEFESILRKTLDAATKQLKLIPNLSPFVTAYTLQSAFGAHVVPVDDLMRDAVVWLGIASPGVSASDAGDALKPGLRKSDAPQFCFLLRQLAVDSELRPAIARACKNASEEDFDPATAHMRLTELFASPKKLASPKKRTARTGGSRTSRTSKPAARKTAKTAKAPARKKATKKAAKKTTLKKRGRATKKKATSRSRPKSRS